MSKPIPRYSKTYERWHNYEIDEAEYLANRKKYRGIRRNEANYNFVFFYSGTQKSGRLAEVYQFKTEFEKGKSDDRTKEA